MQTDDVATYVGSNRVYQQFKGRIGVVTRTSSTSTEIEWDGGGGSAEFICPPSDFNILKTGMSLWGVSFDLHDITSTRKN